MSLLRPNWLQEIPVSEVPTKREDLHDSQAMPVRRFIQKRTVHVHLEVSDSASGDDSDSNPTGVHIPAKKRRAESPKPVQGDFRELELRATTFSLTENIRAQHAGER